MRAIYRDFLTNPPALSVPERVRAFAFLSHFPGPPAVRRNDQGTLACLGRAR